MNATMGAAAATSGAVPGGETKPSPKGAAKKPSPNVNKDKPKADAEKKDEDAMTNMGGTITGGATLNIGGTLVNLDNLTIATYSCDFGNVVVGATKKRSFRFTNVGKLPINFAFDKKILGNYGISIEPDKV